MMCMTGSMSTTVASEQDQVAELPGGETSPSSVQLIVDEGSPAGRLGEAFFPQAFIDQLISSATAEGVALTGRGGMLPELVRAVLERGMAAELTEHLGYAKHDVAGNNSGNSRNGHTPRTVATEIGPVALAAPRDRTGSLASVRAAIKTYLADRGTGLASSRHGPRAGEILQLDWTNSRA